MKTPEQISQKQIPEILVKHLPEYSADKLTIETTFGMTNQTYKIKCQGQQSVIFRVLSQVIDRQFEGKILEILQKNKIGPQLIFNNDQYRIEKVIENVDHPKIQQINSNDQLFKNILIKLHQFHTVELPKQINKKFLNDTVFTPQRRKRYAEKKCSENGKQTQYHELQQRLLKQFDNVSKLIKNEHFMSTKELKLCHNDVNNNNIFKSKEGTITFIDFEYACQNYAAYDIANFLNQCCFSYSDEFPGFKVIKKVTKSDIQKAAKLYPGRYEGIEKDIAVMLKFTNLFWALWSLEVEKSSSGQSFSPLQHGKKRLQLYEFYQKPIFQ